MLSRSLFCLKDVRRPLFPDRKILVIGIALIVLAVGYFIFWHTAYRQLADLAWKPPPRSPSGLAKEFPVLSSAFWFLRIDVFAQAEKPAELAAAISREFCISAGRHCCLAIAAALAGVTLMLSVRVTRSRWKRTLAVAKWVAGIACVAALVPPTVSLAVHRRTLPRWNRQRDTNALNNHYRYGQMAPARSSWDQQRQDVRGK